MVVGARRVARAHPRAADRFPAFVRAILLVTLLCPGIAAAVTAVEEWVARSPGGSGTLPFHPGCPVVAPIPPRVGNVMATDGDDNAYVVGCKTYGVDLEFQVVRYSATGEVVWWHAFGGTAGTYDGAHAVTLDTSGNVLAVGHVTETVGGRNYATIKYDRDGHVLWLRTYSSAGTSHDSAYRVATDASDNVYVTGNGGTGYIVTVKYSPDGERLWVRRFGNVHGANTPTQLKVDPFGNAIVAGMISRPNGRTDILILKYDSQGELLWSVQRTGTGSLANHAANDLAIDAAGNVHVAGGIVNTPAGYGDFFAAKYAPDGSELWLSTYVGVATQSESAVAMALGVDGGVVLTGGSGGRPVTVKFDADGQRLWVATTGVGTFGSGSGKHVATDAVGNVWVAASSGSQFPAYVSLFKYAPDGTLVRNSDYVRPGGDVYGLALDSADGAALLTTESYLYEPREAYVLALTRTDADGGVAWIAAAPMNHDLDESAGGGWGNSAMVEDSDGGLYVAGGSYNGYGEDSMLLKFSPAGALAWRRVFDDPPYGSGRMNGVAVHPQGGVVVTGRRNDGDYTRRYAADGTLLWHASQCNGGSGLCSGTAVAVDADGNTVVVGSGKVGSWNDAFVVKYDADGALLWTRSHGGAGGRDDAALRVAIDADGSIVVLAQVLTTAANQDMATLKYATDGTLLWSALYDGEAQRTDYPVELAIDATGAITIVGNVGAAAASYATKVATVRYGPDGDRRWATEHGSGQISEDEASGLDVNDHGEVVVAAIVRHPTGSVDRQTLAALRYGTDGALRWTGLHRGPDDKASYAPSAAFMPGGRVVLSGRVIRADFKTDVAIAAFEADGSARWSHVWAGAAGEYDSGAGLLASPDGAVSVLVYENLYNNTRHLGVVRLTERCTARYAAGPGGEITGSAEQALACGEDASPVLAQPAANHVFVGWSDGRVGNPRVDQALTHDVEVSAQFALQRHALTLASSAGGSLVPTPGQEIDLLSVPHGSEVVLDVLADPGYRVVSVAGCGGALVGAAFTTAPMQADCAVAASFNRNPVVQNGLLVLSEDAAETTGEVVAEDDDSLVYTLVGEAGLGTAIVPDAAVGRFVYIPHADANGIDELRLRVDDGGAAPAFATISVRIDPVNDAPAMMLGEGPVHPAGSAGAQRVDGFASFVMGPANESTQRILDVSIEGIDDPDAVLVADSVVIDVDGTLRYTLSGNGGSAVMAARVQDDGGTLDGGVDRSVPIAFAIGVDPAVDVQVAIDDARDGALPGETLVYSIIVANAGAAAANDVLLDVVFPAGLDDAQWACLAAQSSVPCPPPPHAAGVGDVASRVDLPPGAFLRFELAATLAPTAVASVEVTARVTLPPEIFDRDESNNIAVDGTLVLPHGVHADGFEPGGSGVSIPAVRALRGSR